MPALSCFQTKRDPFGVSAASSGKAPGIASPAAFSRYKDLHPSLFSNFSLHLSSTSPSLLLVLQGSAPTPLAA